jgi:hypothetical protein
MVCFRPVLRSVGANRLAPARILEPDWIANVALWFAAMVRQQLQCTLVWFESANRLATANLSSIILMDGAPRVLMSFGEEGGTLPGTARSTGKNRCNGQRYQ